MRFEGTQTIQATREQVWAFIMAPEKVGPCAPGFQRVEVTDAEHFKAYVAVGIAAVKATYALNVTLTDLDQPNSATAKAHGMAPAGAVDITGVMRLSDAGNDATTMTWSADVVVSGTLASLGARLMQSTAAKLTAQFFACFKQRLEAPSPPATTTTSPSQPPPAPPSGTTDTSSAAQFTSMPRPANYFRRLLQHLGLAHGAPSGRA